ncbi:MAG: (2Fe-2S) ferredoxin domain-containing protein [Clostridiales bacterium]|nr:(2Fe-2S) ferredoxin domain-containing protein [Clostridiales bacterium]
MVISVCIGSACHLKGSYKIISQLKEKITQHHLENDVTVNASFCLGECSSEGVSVKLDDNVVTGVTLENFEQFFENNVLAAIK